MTWAQRVYRIVSQITNFDSDNTLVIYDDGSINVDQVAGSSLDVNIQDQTTDVIDQYFCQELGSTTLNGDIALEATSLVVSDATGFAVGDCLGIFLTVMINSL